MGPQAVLWFAIGIGALAFAGTLVYRRYVAKAPDAMQSRSSFVLFALLMLFFALGAFAAGFAAMGLGR